MELLQLLSNKYKSASLYIKKIVQLNMLPFKF